MRPLEHLQPVQPVDKSDGRNFVSLRFWQVRDDQADVPEYLHRSRLAARVAQALNPERASDPEGLAKSHPQGSEPYRTVVEAVTFVARPQDFLATEDKPDPLSRCIQVLISFHRAYRVAARAHIPELTYERLHPAVLWFRRAVFEPNARPEPAGLTLLDNTNIHVEEVAPLSNEVLEDISQR